MLGSVAEVQEGSRFIEERNIPAAVEHLERAIKILPFYQVGDASYNSELDNVVSK
jgi:flagellin-specific chaperone FliS